MAQETKALLRLANTDIKGEKTVLYGLTKIYGVGPSFSNAICESIKLDKTMKIGNLSEAQVTEIEEVIANPASKNIPVWILNRRFDMDTGEDTHLTGPKLKLRKEFDIRRMKKIKSYKGVRHMFNLPVRGQRTKGNFRKGRSVGVVKKSATPQKKSAGASSGKKK
ncbi:MAG: 30S ribosomal protein S13 [Nanoarchaeota archaeon]|nr:30S ribosomal protein S13 [Nanoarchaeota archaeon]